MVTVVLTGRVSRDLYEVVGPFDTLRQADDWIELHADRIHRLGYSAEAMECSESQGWGG